MNKKDYKIHIIGAGISGLIAAVVLEKNGYHPTIIDANTKVGGRVTTEIIKGYQLDRGFQVLLEAYPKAKQYLNFKALAPQYFLPGAVIFKNGNQQTIGDALRKPSLLWGTLVSNVATFNDKLKILKLNRRLKKQSLEEIFQKPEQTTLGYLQEFGFSSKVIDEFFKPFFSGIFLEPNLSTSSRMFEYVYKMFGEGLAVLPKDGIGAIPQQLKSKLKTTEFIFNTKVKEVTDSTLVLENGEVLNTHFTIVATAASALIPNLNNQEVKWKRCDTLYFEVEKRNLNKPIIGLVADKGALINNIFFHDSLEMTHNGAHHLLSVTVVKPHQLSTEALVKAVTSDLKTFCNIQNTVFLKHYPIEKALPNLKDLRYDGEPSETQLKPTIYLAGDYMLNGSLNAAMISGERAAQGVIQSLEDGLVVEELTSEYL
ncbi:NAD(P)/FAD-dependent oxidoreductase [Paucihalobacter sp.]|uniref:NAD(P)/FAD-dependent oxidoreductase n=1 Tax=Paucihalobacter sp. TaxID=2850405 RepID=UPI002FE3FE86